MEYGNSNVVMINISTSIFYVLPQELFIIKNLEWVMATCISFSLCNIDYICRIVTKKT